MNDTPTKNIGKVPAPLSFEDFASKKRRNRDEDAGYMEMAIRAAVHAKSNGESPYGAVLAFPGGHMVEHDTCFSDRDRTCHAEMNVLRKALRTRLKKLDDCTLFVTVEPCPMCAHAAFLAGVKEIVFGAYDDANGYISGDQKSWTERIVAKGGVLSEQCIDTSPESTKKFLRSE